MQSIVDFLRERPMISVRGIEQAVGLPNATIKKVSDKVMTLSSKHYDKIPMMEGLLFDYGFDGDKSYKELDDINTGTQDGKMLFAALVRLTTQTYTDKTPYEVLEMLVEDVEKTKD